MVLHENSKIVKIITEMMAFLLDRECKEFTTNVKVNAEETVVVFTMPASSKKACEYLEKNIEPSRLVEAEEYGWELFGLCDDSNELEQVALLIDDISVKKVNWDNYEVTFIRKHR